MRIEASMKLSQALLEERSQKDIAVQQALAQARTAMNSHSISPDKVNNDVTLVTDGKTTFTVQWVNPDMMDDGECIENDDNN